MNNVITNVGTMQNRLDIFTADILDNYTLVSNAVRFVSESMNTQQVEMQQMTSLAMSNAEYINAINESLSDLNNIFEAYSDLEAVLENSTTIQKEQEREVNSLKISIIDLESTVQVLEGTIEALEGTAQMLSDNLTSV